MPSENVSNLAWRHAFVLVALPEPPETFSFDQTDLDRSQLTLFQQNNLIEKASDGTRPHDWRVSSKAYEKATEYADQADTFPCCNESRGVTNDAGQLRCIECGAPVSSEVFHRVIG